MFWYQTPTHITAYILDSKGGSNLEKDLASLEKLKQWTFENFGPEKEQTLKNKISLDPLMKDKILLQNNHLLLTREGKLFADGLAAELFF